MITKSKQYVFEKEFQWSGKLYYYILNSRLLDTF